MSDVRFEQLEPRTTPGVAYRAIRQAILDGAVPPGEQLREAHIAEEMGISRAPLREALSRLVDDGLVVKIAYRGAFVREVQPGDVADVAALRALVEPWVVRRSLGVLRRQHASDLVEAVAAMSPARVASGGELIDAHLALHRWFYLASGSHLLLQTWRTWQTQLRMWDVQRLARCDGAELARRVAPAHHRLVAAVLHGSPEQAAGAVAAHLRRAEPSCLDAATPTSATAAAPHAAGRVPRASSEPMSP